MSIEPDKIEMCGHPTKLAMEPCIREPDHDGPHYWWHQSLPEADGSVGVTVYEDAGPRGGVMIYHFDCNGSMEAWEVAAITALMELRHAH